MQRTPLYRQTPPAIFPVTLGFLGLGYAWLGAAPLIGIPVALAQVLTGVATMYFLFFAISYLTKLILRPTTVVEDLFNAPNRAGVAALPISLMMLSLAMLAMKMPIEPVLWIGVILYLIVIVMVSLRLRADAPELRQFSPFQYLSFVALIVAAIPTVGYGYNTIALVFALVSLIPFAVISVGWLSKLVRVRPPAPLRPSVAIVLAPISLFALVFWLLGIGWLAMVFYVIAMTLFIICIALFKWLTIGGWSPVWGAFTFPIAALANTQLVAYNNGMGSVAFGALVISLAIGTPLILYIVYKHTMAWTRGDLSKKTGAAVA